MELMPELPMSTEGVSRPTDAGITAPYIVGSDPETEADFGNGSDTETEAGITAL